MRIFTVHINLHRKTEEQHPIIVRESFSFGSFVLSFIWALYHRCWVLAAALFLGEFFIHGLLMFFHAELVTVLICQIGLSLLIGFQFNDWRRAALIQADWSLDSVVAAVDSDAAFLRWMESKKSSFTTDQSFYGPDHSGNNL